MVNKELVYVYGLGKTILGFAPTQQQAKDRADELTPIIIEGTMYLGFTLAVEPSEVYQEQPSGSCILWDTHVLDCPSWLEME
jgi:hypothetical protein